MKLEQLFKNLANNPRLRNFNPLPPEVAKILEAHSDIFPTQKTYEGKGNNYIDYFLFKIRENERGILYYPERLGSNTDIIVSVESQINSGQRWNYTVEYGWFIS